MVVSHPQKVLFPASVSRRLDLAEYYLRIADTMLPHLASRPIAMERYPDGIGGERIFQKDVPDYFPDWVDRASVEKAGGTLTQVVCTNAATLVYLADLACITPHAWLSRIDLPTRPDQLVFDLDPPGDDFAAARAAALALRSLLDELDLPLLREDDREARSPRHRPARRATDFDSVRSVAREVAPSWSPRHPSQLTLEQRKGAGAAVSTST